MPNAFGLPDDENRDVSDDRTDVRDTVPDLLVVAPYRGPWQVGEFPHCRVVNADCGHRAWLSRQGEPFFGMVRSSCLDCSPQGANGEATRLAPGAMEYLREGFGDAFVEGVARPTARRYHIDEG